MSSIGILVPDLLSEIMRRLPPEINQKFAFSQVSRYWRNAAVQDHLFWSSFSGGRSKADCSRIPILLQRSGSAMLHIRYSFIDGNTPMTDWQTYAMEVLVPHVARIETLHVKFPVYSNRTLSVQALLNSGLEFPALQTLHLEGPKYGPGPAPRVLLTAPRLRTLHVECFDSANWRVFLSLSLESITLSYAESTSPQTLLDIFDLCPRAWRVVLRYGGYGRRYPDDFFEAFAHRRPLAPALRELELATPDPDLGHILKAGFSDTVLRTITGRLYDSDMDLLTQALLPGLGSLVIFGLAPGTQQLELHDDSGHIRRLQCWNEDSSFEIDWVWEYLCIHYHLHETVREIRIAHWDDDETWNQYTESFQRYPPQLTDGITLVLAASDFSFSADEDEDSDYIPKTMRIPGLAKVDFHAPLDRPILPLKLALRVLAHIEPPQTRKVEVCIHNMTLLPKHAETGSFGVFQAALSGDSWAICTECTRYCGH
ncbi:hypothetical protein C8R45DRAFT_955639 [Mycena sanguinolenta]|nr:hypothetical protein C8R45DRAFT_955639 [Mycena sanguinolenta]